MPVAIAYFRNGIQKMDVPSIADRNSALRLRSAAEPMKMIFIEIRSKI